MHIKNILIVISFLFISNLSAETFSKGSATIEIKKPKKVSAEETAMARNKAVESAWKKYTGKFNKSRMKQYMLIKEDIMSTLDDYINDVQVLDNTVDTGTKTLRTVVKISINDVALDAKLSLTSAAGGTGASQGSTIVAYYINRETGSRKTFKAKETNISANESAKKVTDSMQGDTDSISSSDVNKTQSGGSTEQKADKVSYRVAKNITPKVITTALNEIFAPAGFQFNDFDKAVSVADPYAEFLEIEMSVIEEEFVEKDGRLGRKTRGQINRVLKELEAKAIMVNYLVEIVTDINLAYTDSVTGNQKVDVSLSGSVTDVTNPLSGEVAAFTLVSSGSGQDAITAANNAVKNAAVEAAQQIVDQLNSKGIN